VAVAYARAPEAAAIRTEIARSLLDLLAAGPATRLAASRDLVGRARDLAEALGGPLAPPPTPSPGRGRRAGGRAAPLTAAAPTELLAAAAGDAAEVQPIEADDDAAVAGRKLAPAERRRAARELVGIWRSVARDLAVAGLGGQRIVRDIALLDEVERAAAALPRGAAGVFLARLDAVSEMVAGNVAPELAIDVLLLAWPTAVRDAA
jgi:hypothetical protein